MIKSDLFNLGQIVEKTTQELLFIIWQGHIDDYQTYCGVVSFSKDTADM
jgi:hypothetical protein